MFDGVAGTAMDALEKWVCNQAVGVHEVQAYSSHVRSDGDHDETKRLQKIEQFVMDKLGNGKTNIILGTF